MSDYVHQTRNLKETREALSILSDRHRIKEYARFRASFTLYSKQTIYSRNITLTLPPNCSHRNTARAPKKERRVIFIKTTSTLRAITAMSKSQKKKQGSLCLEWNTKYSWLSSHKHMCYAFNMKYRTRFKYLVKITEIHRVIFIPTDIWLQSGSSGT